MDKYEYQAKLEEINKLVDRQDYEAAAAIADTIEWKRVRSVRTLCMVSELYEAIGRAEDSKAILYRAYRRSPNSRQILYRLTEACVQTQDFDDAVEYYTEYVNLSPNDNSKYILKYEIYKGRGSSVEEQISVLEEYKSREYTEQWAYELAKLYDQAGMSEKCVAECDDLALWFHNGKYVVQALELKKKYAPLTPEQQTVYDNPSEIVDMETKEEVVGKAVLTLDEAITNDLPKSEKDVIADSILMDTEKEIAASVQAPAQPAQVEQPVQTEQPVQPETPAAKPVKDLSMVELQSELANSMRQILSGIKPAPVMDELESVPLMQKQERVVPEVEEIPEEPVSQRRKIDDLLTNTVEEKPLSYATDALTAPTIDLSQKLKQEIGDASVREYAAMAAKAAKEAEMIQESPVQLEQPKPVMEQPKPMMEQPKEAPAQQEPVIEQPKEEEQPVQVDPTSYKHEIMDEKEKSMLGFWGGIRGMSEQVNQAVTQIMRSVLTDKTSASGNIVMVGDAGNGRTTLAISMAKIISRCKGQQSAKVAKIYAEDFNAKDIAATVAKMAGGVLIIEEAGDLDDNAVAQLSMAMEFKTDSLVVVLEDERRYLQDLLARNPQFAQKFDVTVNVPMLTNDELVEFGRYYTEQQECVMDESAVMALYDAIAVMQSPEQPVAILDVKEIVDKAIKHANRFGLGKVFSSLSGKRYDEFDRVILKSKNFKKIK